MCISFEERDNIIKNIVVPANIIVFSYKQRTNTKKSKVDIVLDIINNKIDLNKSEKDKVIDSYEYKNTIFFSYLNLLKKEINGFKKHSSSFDDLIQGSFIPFVNAYYSYRREDIKFSSYLFMAVKHWIYNENNYNITGIHYKTEAARSLKKFKLMQSKMPDKSFDEILDVLDLNENQKKFLFMNYSNYKTKTIHAENKDNINNKGYRDYNKIDDIDLIEKIKSKLSKTELFILQYMIDSNFENGWQTKISIERNTTRQAINETMKRIRKKSDLIINS